MKLIKKFLGIAAVIAVIGFMVLPLTGCPEAGDNDNKKNTPTTETPTIYYTGGNIEEFAAWLAEQDEGVLCDVKLTLDDLEGLVSVLKMYPNKKVSLDLSDSTFTSIGNGAFSGCSNLASIIIPNSVTSIETSAFDGCTSLTGVTIPSSVTSIERFAFDGCTSLTGITVDENNTSFASVDGILYNREKTNIILVLNGITGNVTIPDSVTSIENSAFSGCTSLTGVTIPSSVTSIGYNTFSRCTSLVGITIPSSVTSIGNFAFSRCTSLTGVTIPSSVTSIGYDAFSGCTSLTGVTFQGTIVSTGFDNNAFFGLGDLRSKFYTTDPTNGTPGTYTTTAPVSDTSVWTKQN